MRFSLLVDLATAVGFLTLAPAPGGGGLDRLARAAGFFPLVGAFVGAAGGAAAALALWAGFGPWLAAAFAVAAQTVLTGGLHEDGLADFADGLGGRDRAARLAAMRDGAVGAWAVLALGGVMTFRVGALAGILASGGAVAGLAALVATGALGWKYKCESHGSLTYSTLSPIWHQWFSDMMMNLKLGLSLRTFLVDNWSMACT